MDRTGAVWRGRPDRVRIDPRPVICGRRRDLPAAPKSAALSPSTGVVLAVIAECGQDIVGIAVDAARREFDQGDWRRISSSQRAEVLRRWADLVEDCLDELAVLLAMETGSPVAQCYGVDLAGVLRSIRWHAAVIDQSAWRAINATEGAIVVPVREPAGVVAVVTPSSCPLAQFGQEVIAAMAVGNAVLIKPALQAGLTILRLAELARAAGVPRGTLAVLTGGELTGECLGRHPDIDVVSVTGSAAVGEAFFAYSSASNGKTVWAKTAGRSTAIVCADTRNLAAAARRLARGGAHFEAGQMCTAPGRILVERSVVDEFVELVAAAFDELVVGDPMDWTTDVGPVRSRAVASQITGAIAGVAERGARVVRGEHVPARASAGAAFVPPTLLRGDAADLRGTVTGISGPVTTVLAVDDVGTALDAACELGVGIPTSVWTRNLGTAQRVARRLGSGTIWVAGADDDELTVLTADAVPAAGMLDRFSLVAQVPTASV
ncbi:aldehyde dehydrogenase family protein [Nocardia asteroides]|uniref:aldehyde dehydrogenase family protein n=1 Tax=Nocardia asteroides TaxID=1824 RepID=UPI001E3B3AC9|nr:aldehyde dehydrogenase family protein [Nocardia asteroides]UGT58813.1 aldehyde dehydrogenase family protein [Nocardia asteroides]